MFEQRFLSVLALSLGIIALTVASIAVVESALTEPTDTRGCGLEPVPEVGVSVLRCADPFDPERSLVWAVWTHASHCVAESGALPGPWRLECDNGVSFQLDSSHDGAWRSCGVSWRDDARHDLSSTCDLSR